MKYQLNYRIEISFQLDNDNFKLLTDYIKNNSQLSHYAEYGEFWFGAINSRRFLKTKKEKESRWITCTTREMDTVLLKACEMYAYSENPMAKELYNNLWALLKNAIDASNSLNMHAGIVEVNNGKVRL